MPRRSLHISLLLFLSGTCALIYQVAWLRELRLVFGASTPATAAVLAVFMAGLGYGSLVLGQRADRAQRPLWLYGQLEAGITLSAALSPLLLLLARAGYIAAGGTIALGLVAGTIVRLGLSALVLLTPTLLMGGTLPAAARAAAADGDTERRSIALLYGLNTLGAVTGAAVANFVLLEVFGTRLTLWLGCLINALVVVGARALDRRHAQEDSRLPAAKEAQRPDEDQAPRATRRARPLVLAAAAIVGCAFLLMELVWYRMLSPLLGGSTYTFGLILAVALLGIGLGGLAYTSRRRTPTLRGFAASCSLEALFIAIPYALGDRLAVFALLLRPLGALGLAGHMLAWTAVTAIVVLPAAVVAGYQFPLLIGLLGRGGRQVGRDVGHAYAANTAGAITGSLLGGFIVLPLLTATGAWRAVVLVLFGLAAVSLIEHRHSGPQRPKLAGLLPSGALALSAPVLLSLSVGPTAVWRHSPIGAGRVDYVAHQATRNSLQEWQHERRRGVVWEVDGRESSIALFSLADTAFLVAGKSDGEAVSDAGTQVMSGLLGALLHAEPRNVLVVGLGTGSTAGWLAAVPTIERVDVVEIEPALEHVARVCAPVNRDVLHNPKVATTYADAREVLLTTPQRYDVIFSEPSNPYRAGIASLFTREFYEAAAERLRPGGIFAQFVQGYEIDGDTVRSVLGTLSAAFASVSIWRTERSDLLLLAGDGQQILDVPQLRRRVAAEPYRSALLTAWRVDSLEGVLAHHIARPELAAEVAAAQSEASLNTDDRNLLEFAMARTVGRSRGFQVEDLVQLAMRRRLWRPATKGGEIDWRRVEDAYITMDIATSIRGTPLELPRMTAAQRQRHQALLAYSRGRPAAAVAAWQQQSRGPDNPVEVRVLAESYVALGDEAALPLIDRIRAWQPIDADALSAQLRLKKGRPQAAFEALSRAIVAHRTDPWADKELLSSALSQLIPLGQADPALARAAFDLLAEPFAVGSLRYLRLQLRFQLAPLTGDPSLCVEALLPYEPYVPWEATFLSARLRCYEENNHERLAQARSDRDHYRDGQGRAF